MTSSTQAYTAVLNGARNAAENTAQVFKQGTETWPGRPTRWCPGCPRWT